MMSTVESAQYDAKLFCEPAEFWPQYSTKLSVPDAENAKVEEKCRLATSAKEAIEGNIIPDYARSNRRED